MSDYSKLYTIYKTKVGPVRKDGSRLVRAYGCNGREHRVQTDAIWCDAEGRDATAGKARVKPDKVIGECQHNRVCKNYGSFILM
jgi:hypothetical protein